MRRPLSTQTAARETNGSQRPNGHLPQTELPSVASRTTTTALRPQIELHTVVTTTSEAKVTTALIQKSHGKEIQSESKSNSKANEAMGAPSSSSSTVLVEINNEKDHKIKINSAYLSRLTGTTSSGGATDEGSSLVLDSQCEECCRCCSCGETVSSAEGSVLEDIMENPPSTDETVEKITKFTISTQTSN